MRSRMKKQRIGLDLKRRQKRRRLAYGSMERAIKILRKRVERFN